MPVPTQRDSDTVRTSLETWLGTKVGAADLTLSSLPGPAFSGFSNETLLFDAVWSEGGDPRSLGIAVRLEPSGHQVFPDTLVETQIKVMQALGPTVVPAPRILWHEPDPSVLGSAFFVMPRLTGRVPPDNPPYHVAGWLHEVTPEVRERIWWNGL